MRLSDLQTIAGIMHNDCPDGTIDVVHARNTYYCPKLIKTVPDGTVPRGVVVQVVWHRDGHESKTIGTFRTVNSGFPADVELETIKAGVVGRYLNVIKWASS